MTTKVKRLLVGGVFAFALLLFFVQLWTILWLAARGKGVDPEIARLGFCAIAVAWSGHYLKRLFVTDEERGVDRPLASIAVLLSEPRLMTEEGLSRAVENAIGVQFDPTDPQAEQFVSGQSPTFFLQVRDFLFQVNNCKGGYHRDALVEAKCVPDERLQPTLVEHCSWLSIDLILYPEGSSVDAAFRIMCPVISELSGTDFLALHCPTAGYWGVWEESLHDVLQSTDPLGALEFGYVPPPVEAPDSEPALIVAAEQARSRWPEFVQAFQGRQSTQAFYVKVRLAEGDDQEFPWLSVRTIRDEGVVGTVDKEPETPGIRPGAEVQAALNDIWDWMILPPGGGPPIGFFGQDSMNDPQTQS
jgi:uncharacterized protein YegJ (DUF2314 family)